VNNKNQYKMSCFVPTPVWHVPMGQGEGASISDKWNIMAHSALHPIAFWSFGGKLSG